MNLLIILLANSVSLALLLIVLLFVHFKGNKTQKKKRVSSDIQKIKNQISP